MDEIEQIRQRGQARRLAQVLLAQPSDLACADCLDVLEQYIAGQAAGADYTVVWPAVAQHLDSCLTCTEAYALLYELRMAERAQPLPAHIPTPDLGFLQDGAAGPLTPGELRAARRAGRLRGALASAVERAGARLQLTLSQALLELLAPPSVPALAFRDGTEPGPPLFELELAEPGGEVERLRLSAYAEAGAAELCVVRVQLALREREWPELAGVPVALALGEQRRQASTDAWGEAIFEDVPAAALSGLRVEVDAGVG